MDLNPSTNWALLGENMFSDNELLAIHEASLEILAKTGIYYEEEDARNFYKQAGAEVNEATKIVKIPNWLVEESIKSAPGRYSFCGRDPRYDYVLEYGRVGFAPVGVAPALRDLDTGKSRPSLKTDLEDYAHLIDQLDNIPMVWDCIQPTDVPEATAGLHAFECYVKNSRKNIMTTNFDRLTAKACIEMAAAVVGGKDKLKERPIITAGSCPKSPLTASKSVTSSVIEYALAGLPCLGMPMVLSGATGPVTLAGTLVQHNAEVLGNLALSQIVRRGTPFLYGSCTSLMDLRKAQCGTGCAEHAMFGAAIARLAHFYNVPCVAPGSWTDSKCLDLQAGMEKAFSAVIPALAGANLVFGAGGLAGGMLVDFASLVVEDDLYQMIQFMLKGFAVNDSTMAVNLIKEVGPKGEFLTLPHTAQNMRQHQNWPHIFNRDSEAVWFQEGGRSIDEIATEKAKELIANPNPSPLSQSVQTELAYIIKHTEKELGVAE